MAVSDEDRVDRLHRWQQSYGSHIAHPDWIQQNGGFSGADQNAGVFPPLDSRAFQRLEERQGAVSAEHAVSQFLVNETKTLLEKCLVLRSEPPPQKMSDESNLVLFNGIVS